MPATTASGVACVRPSDVDLQSPRTPKRLHGCAAETAVPADTDDVVALRRVPFLLGEMVPCGGVDVLRWRARTATVRCWMTIIIQKMVSGPGASGSTVDRRGARTTASGKTGSRPVSNALAQSACCFSRASRAIAR